MPVRSIGGLRRWLFFLVLVGLIVVAFFLAIAAIQPGATFWDRVGAAYRWLWTNTTGRQYTDMMQENPWLFIIPGIGVVVLAGWLLPRKYWARAILLYISFALGFVAGHVFW